MRWQKLGLLFVPDGSVCWMRSHAAVPTAVPLGGDEFRIYFSSRDVEGRSQVGSIDVDIHAAQRTGLLSERPLLSPGTAGRFDHSGTMLSWITKQNGLDYFYYIGWNRAIEVPFRNSLGLLVRDSSGRKPDWRLPGPVLDRSPVDPCFVASACVLVEAGLWRMWYLSCVDWERNGTQLRHKYHIKYAESSDGVWWRRDGRICIDFANHDEYAISRPSVLRDAKGYHMWYSYRGAKYRIGYAFSHDGLMWERRDHDGGLSVTLGEWDGDMVEYPFVFDHAGHRYMLYNGDGYGKTGFGLAVLKQD